MTARRCVILRSSASRRCTASTLSRIVVTGKRGPWIRLRRIARRRRVSVAEQLRRDEKERRGVERASWADQPLVAVVRRHVVRRQQHGVVARRVQVAIRPVDDDRLGQHDAALRPKILDRVFVMLGAVDALRARGWSDHRQRE